MKKTYTLSALVLLSSTALAQDATMVEMATVVDITANPAIAFEAATDDAVSVKVSSEERDSDAIDDKKAAQRAHAVNFWKMSDMAYIGDKAAVERQMADYNVQSFMAKTGVVDGVETHFGYVFSKIVNGKLQVFIATRGTDTAEDGLTDGQVSLSALNPSFHGPIGSLVHTGFQDASLSAQAGIRSCLEGLKTTYGEEIYRSAEISMCGHSLGAAMTLLNSAWLKAQTDLAPKGIEEIVTFGMPSSGDQSLVKYLGLTSTQQSHFYQLQDPVARLKANDWYAYPLNGVQLPSQDVTVDPLSTHTLGGYLHSLDAYFGLKSHTVGYISGALDHPVVNATVIPLINALGNTVSEAIQDPVMQTAIVKYLSDNASAAVEWVFSWWTRGSSK
ncbi:MAG: lipase family protein [Alphaproteobacteria bacterium]|nr:lipase family protein [Alphaproteobacteria bacterium]OJV47540.1 MAG: hypothetical protein BGO28_06810 [Alphaproteobacteria bacterium 43-37]